MSIVQLWSSDKQIFEVTETIARKSVVIQSFLEEQEPQSSNGEKLVIPLQNVRGKILKMVIEWISKHVGEESKDEELQAWENEFFDLDLDHMYEVIMAANYLEVNDLLHQACQKIADIIAGKQPEEIRKIFNIENDFTPEEEAEIRRQNAWVFETPSSSK